MKKFPKSTHSLGLFILLGLLLTIQIGILFASAIKIDVATPLNNNTLGLLSKNILDSTVLIQSYLTWEFANTLAAEPYQGIHTYYWLIIATAIAVMVLLMLLWVVIFVLPAWQRAYFLFRTVAEHTSDWKTWFTVDKQPRWINRAVERVTGYSVAECLAMNDYPFSLVHPDDQKLLTTQLEKVIEGQVADNLLFRVIRKDRQIKWVTISWEPIADPTNQLLGFLANIRDVTESAKTLHRSAMQLQEAQQMMQLGSWMWNLATNEEYWSEETFCIFGLPFTDAHISHETFMTFIHPEDAQSVQQAITHAIQHHQSYQIEFRIIRTDHAIRYLQSFGKAISDAEGKTLTVMGTIQDVTARKQIEEELQRSEARLAEAQQLARLGHWEWDLTTGRESCSQEMLSILGLNQDVTFTHELFERAIFSADQEKVLQAFSKAIATDQQYNIEFRIVRTDDSLVYIHALGKLVRDPNGKPLRFMGTAQDISDRKHAEEALSQSEERFDLAMRGSNDGLWDWNVETNEIYYSPRWKEMIGFADNELDNRLDWEVERIHPDDRQQVVSTIADYLQRKIPNYEVSFRMLHKNGYYVWILSRGIAIWSAENQPLRFVGTHVDLTAQKEAEAKIKQVNAELNQFKTTLDMTLDGVCMLEAETMRFFYVNQGIVDQVGYSHEKLVTMTLFDLDEETIIAGNHQKTTIARGSHPVLRYETRFHRQDGLYFPVEVFLQYIQAEGQKNRFVAIVRDISERKQAEEQLRLASTYNRNLIEASLDPLVTISTEGRIIDVNAATETVTGYSRNELIGTDFSDYFTEPQQARLGYQQVFKEGMVRDYELTIQHRNGHATPVLYNASVYQDQTGRVHGVFAAARDMTERKRIEEKFRLAKEAAEVANHAKSAFLANMSHELRTPLNGILGYTQIFKRDPTLTPQQQEGIDIIHRSGEYLLTLISDILDLSKIEAGRMELYTNDFHLHDFLNDLVRLFKLRAKQKQVAFVYEPTLPLPTLVHTDEKRLRQILINLLSNAVKYTQQGQVTFKVSTINSWQIVSGSKQENTLNTNHFHRLRFQVADTGIGIPSNQLENIFTPFQQLNDSNYVKNEGTGLGLSITKKLVDMMAGLLEVESIQGEGSTFSVEIDLQEISRHTSETSHLPPAIVGFEGSPRTILVVDDWQENRSVLINLLSPLGFEVIEATDGEEGIEKARTLHPDAILMDLVMPTTNGFDAVRQIRQLEGLEKTPIIAISASAFAHHQQQSMNVGCNDFIAKPFRSEELLKKLQEYLQLTWIYRQKVTETENLFLNVTESFPSIAPSSEQALTLFELSRRGDIEGIIEFVKKIEQETPSLRPFTSKILYLAERYNTQEIKRIARYYVENF